MARRSLLFFLALLISFGSAFGQVKHLTLTPTGGFPADYLTQWQKDYIPAIESAVGPPSENLGVQVYLIPGYQSPVPTLSFNGLNWTIWVRDDPTTTAGQGCMQGTVNTCFDFDMALAVINAYETQISYSYSNPVIPQGLQGAINRAAQEIVRNNVSRYRAVGPAYGGIGALTFDNMVGFQSTLESGTTQINAALIVTATQASGGHSGDWQNYRFWADFLQDVYSSGGAWISAMSNAQKTPIDGVSVHDWLNRVPWIFWFVDLSAGHVPYQDGLSIFNIPLASTLYDTSVSAAVYSNNTAVNTGTLNVQLTDTQSQVVWTGSLDLAKGFVSVPKETFLNKVGAFTVRVSGVAGGQSVSASSVVGFLPNLNQIFPNGVADLGETKGLFVLVTDAAGNAVDRQPSVAGGQVVWYQNGVAFIQPTDFSLPSQVTVNGQLISLPLPWTRAKTVVVQIPNPPQITDVVTSTWPFDRVPLSPRAHHTLRCQNCTDGGTAITGINPVFKLAGAAVTVCGIPTQIWFASLEYGQINIVTPSGIQPGQMCDVTLTTSQGTATFAQKMPVVASAPRIFSFIPYDAATGVPLQVVVPIDVDPTGWLIGPPFTGTDPPMVQAKAGMTVTAWGTGCGARYDDTKNTPPEGVDCVTPSVTVGGMPATKVHFGLVQGFTGLAIWQYVVPNLPPSSAPYPVVFGGDNPSSYNIWIGQ